jgi:hypothetical protein
MVNRTRTNNHLQSTTQKDQDWATITARKHTSRFTIHAKQGIRKENK